ncbi:GGDEF domain-containing protein [Alteromonas facilis]|uniref:GGDEF domain-containing protein n=1 Tax=Alteromonas facilis TaxID=2048004 RepID=UPI000C281F32|nr:GGDEF domain-containing protein [Alteromonas facilis]
MDFTISTSENAYAASETTGYRSIQGQNQDFSQPITHAIEYTAFLNLMLATIDLDELCENYFQYLAGKLPLRRLSFSIDNEGYAWGDSREDAISIALPCASRRGLVANLAKYIEYQFSRLLTLQEQQTLHDLHTHFCIPLGHAIAYRRLLNQATTDILTGLGNRAGFEQHSQRAFGQLNRHDVGFGLLVIDLDNFKQVNDSHGHLQGDKVLQDVAAQLKHSLRDDDIAFRFGGDEFCCLVNAVNKRQLKDVAKRILLAIADSSLLKQHRITASIGGAMAHPQENIDSLFSRADRAVYQVKAQNKNGIIVSDR